MTLFGNLEDGRAVEAVHLRAGGLTATVITFGATLQSLTAPDREGRGDDITLGFDSLEAYAAGPSYLGCTVGRCANRIAGGRFTLDGVQYQLTQNDGANSLHGGVDGFDRRLWTLEDHGESHVRLSLISPDGDQGYPGELRLSVTYSLIADGLRIDYEATCDRPTLVNPTNHTLWNLSGAQSLRGIDDIELTLFADAITPIDATLIPTGELSPVAGTAFDFTQARRIGERVRDGGDDQIRIGRGYDHNFVLRGGRTSEPKPAARLYDPVSGRRLDMLTTEPGVQVYSGNFLDGSVTGKNGRLYRQGDGLALEAQTFPDAANHADFPSARLDPGETYRQTTLYRFFTE